MSLKRFFQPTPKQPQLPEQNSDQIQPVSQPLNDFQAAFSNLPEVFLIASSRDQRC